MVTNVHAEPRSIWVVDDDSLFRGSIAHNLKDRGYHVESFADGVTLLENIGSGKGVDLLLLDWLMPDLNGIDVLREVRSKGLDVPVIFLTVLSEQIYEEAALLGGAVDFIEKSRSFAIVEKRIQLILQGPHGNGGRGDEASENTDLDLGPLYMDINIRRAFWHEEAVDLTRSEFDMVHILAKQPNRDAAYRDIYGAVRGPNFHSGNGDEGCRANVRSSIKRIRQKFRDLDPSFDCIKNYPGFGYRWKFER